jgi:cell wall-associated NlpC family hydrolase
MTSRKSKILSPVFPQPDFLGMVVANFPIGVFLVACLLAGCRADGSFAASTIPVAESIQPVVTPSPSASVTAGIPTLTLTATSASPASGPFEFVVRTPKADVWDAPENENQYWNLQTQLLLGEKVLVLDRRGEWSQVVAVEQPSKKDPRGYPGWVRSELLASGWPMAQQFAVVMKSRSLIRTEPGGPILLSVSFDTRLPAESAEEDWIQVRLPDGAEGWLPLRDVRITEDLAASIPADGLFALAESLAGLPYRWGGTTADSLDCSGLPYRLFHAYGIQMSRDADDQALEGEFIGRYDVRKGDLIFVSESSGGKITHEVIYWGNNMVMDADTVKGVMIRPMPEFFVYYFWITARRFLP